MSYSESKSDDLIETLEEYNRLLITEIESMVTLAHVHGWRSDNVEKGKELRLKIEGIKEYRRVMSICPSEPVVSQDQEEQRAMWEEVRERFSETYADAAIAELMERFTISRKPID